MDVAEHIRRDDYLRKRLTPKLGDETYLHLSDLRLALERVATDEPLVILDYGCGGSPYRSLFPNADYRRADVAGEDLDYIINKGGRIDERAGVFDFILSTQVLEHVAEPETYLCECYRLLKQGGRLYLTTHGSYPDHDCPFDFYRWTADGLTKDLQEAGFVVERIEKHTTGPRLFFLQFDYYGSLLSAPRGTAFGVALYFMRKGFSLLRPWVHEMCDRHFARNRVVTMELERHNAYVVAACLAHKI